METTEKTINPSVVGIVNKIKDLQQEELNLTNRINDIRADKQKLAVAWQATCGHPEEYIDITEQHKQCLVCDKILETYNNE